MNEIKVVNEQVVLGKEFKIYGSMDNPLFLAKDIAEMIDYAKTGKGSYDVSKMLKLVDEEEKLVRKMFVSGQNRDVAMLTEDGLYEVLMQSTKPIARQFKKEVKKILKQLRLTGAAFVKDREEEAINTYFPTFSEEVKLAMVQDLREQNKRIKQQLEEAKPMIDFAETVASSSDSIDVGEMAKLCNKEGINIGRNRLFEFLRESAIFRQNNEPYQKYIDNGWFEVIETTKNTPYGTKLFVKVLVKGKGQIKIVELVRSQYKKSA